ncbi:MAG: DUF1294 domain-containing protein [Planctomycetota bacterium]|jgi:uncharacterized membrane protein YsdA (DUF1294 family)
MKQSFGLLFLLALGLSGALAALLSLYGPRWDPIWAWLASITGFTFLIYGFDKAQAIRNNTRIPESVLLLLVLVGGTAGALLGMVLFRHKTIKGSFRVKFWGVVILQAACAAAWFLYLEPRV